jgi:hypothetical protein
MSRRTVGIVLAAIGVVGIAGSVVWEHVAEPKLVKYPTDVDESPEYEGTVKIFLDRRPTNRWTRHSRSRSTSSATSRPSATRARTARSCSARRST